MANDKKSSGDKHNTGKKSEHKTKSSSQGDPGDSNRGNVSIYIHILDI